MKNRAVFYLVSVLFSVVLISSCDKGPKSETPPPKPDPRAEFVKSLKGANVEGFNFATTEDKTKEVTSLTNGAVAERVNVDKKSNGIVLRYTAVKDKNANTAKTYKTEIAKSGDAFELQITDIATGEVTFKKAFPQDDNGDNPPPPPPNGCGNFESCSDFICKKLPPIQCDVNKTCEPQIVATTCCNNGGLISIHFIVKPTVLRCRLLNDVIPDILDGIVFVP